MKNIIILVLLLSGIVLGQTYQYAGYLHQSSPEVSLFYMNPSYISPAQAYGVTGMFANPAALGFTTDYGLAFSFGPSVNPKIKCKFKVLDSTQTQNELRIPFELGFKDAGGVNYFGISKKLGPVGLGLGYMQRSATGIGFNFNASSDTFIVDYSFKDTVVASYPSGDTNIPITWNLSAPIVLDGIGNGEFTLAKQPLFLGAGISSGIASFGLGMKYNNYSGTIDANIMFAGGAHLNGSGIAEPPYKGVVDVTATIPYDTLIVATGDGDFSVSRPSIVLGGLVHTNFFKMGFSLEKSFQTELNGNFNIYSMIVEDNPDSIIEDTNFVHFIFPDSIAGRMVLRTEKTRKTSDTNGFQGPVTLPGYTQIDFGISLFVLDLYLGGTIPQKQEINNVKAGMLLNIPLPVVTLRTGVLANLDYFYTNDKKIISLRAPVYLGLGGSVRTKFDFLPVVPDAQIDFAVKTNAVPLFSKTIFDLVNEDNEFDMISDFESPSFLSLLSFNLGLTLTL